MIIGHIARTFIHVLVLWVCRDIRQCSSTYCHPESTVILYVHPSFLNARTQALQQKAQADTVLAVFFTQPSRTNAHGCCRYRVYTRRNVPGTVQTHFSQSCSIFRVFFPTWHTHTNYGVKRPHIQLCAA